MGNEDGSEDRLTKNEFAELIQHLSVQEILTIEYRIGSVWKKLFLRKNAQTHNFCCNLCVLETSSFKNLLAHLDGRKHNLQMERVDQLYQQDYTYPKNYKKETVADEEKLESVEDNNTCLTVEKGTVDVQNKNNACSKSSTDAENRNKIGECGQVCESKNEKDNATPQENSDGQSKNMQEANAKPDIKATKPIPVLKETRKSVSKHSEKRCFVESCNNKNMDLKKAKIVVNPAAVLSTKINSARVNESDASNKKPEYQTDRIIIPTAHKKKSNDEPSPALASQVQANSSPKFATKSYSFKSSENDVYGILGVEYVIKILKNRTDISPRYECGLCELVLDGFAMQRHLEGYNHRLKFCEKHFPTAIRQYRQYIQNVPESEIFKVMAPVLGKLAHAIEQHHGRNLPYECYERDFILNRHEILAKAFSCRHASEQYGPTFTHVVGSKEIDEFINNRHKYLPPTFSRSAIFDSKPDGVNNKSNNRHQNFKNADRESNLRERHRHANREKVFSDGNARRSYTSCLQDVPFQSYVQAAGEINIPPVDDETYNLMVDDFLKGTLKGVSRKSSFHKRPSSVQNSNSEKRKSLSPLRQDDIWQAYRHLVDQELYKLEERFKQYRTEPESHPSYNDEWQKFWKRRKDELVSAGLDHRNYNYQPDWVRFIKIRIEELYQQEIENVKIKSRERLCLPMSNEKLTDTKYHLKSQQRSLSNELTEAEYNSQKNSGTLACSENYETQNSNTPQVVSVLRLMTALEDSLGSLGPKIIDLLSKALQAEKINPLHVNAIILNDDNCSLIETAKEKLKGLVITGLFEGSKKKVLQHVVTDAEALLHYAYQFKKELSSQRSSTTETPINQTQNISSFSRDSISSNVSNALKNQSGTSNFLNKTTPASSLIDNFLPRSDKKELASKLAASLVAQGKTDFDPSQLQQIIKVYKLIEKKKRETAGTVLSNRSYFQDSSSSSKKTLSDTLSDLLKGPPSSVNVNSDIGNFSKTSDNATATSDSYFCSSSVIPGKFVNNEPSNSITSVLQNPRDNFYNNTARSMTNAHGANNAGGNLTEQQRDYTKTYINNSQSNPPNFNMSNIYGNQFQSNSRVAQNWGWNSNMNVNQNRNMGNPNNSLNQNYNWQQY